MIGLSQGVQAGPGWFANYLANPPAEAQQISNGATPLSRVQGAWDRWQTRQRSVQLDRYQSLRESCAERVTEADEAVDVLKDRAEEWISEMESGDLEPDQVIKNIAEAMQVLRAVSQTYADAERDADAAYAMVDLTPIDYTTKLAERFPSMSDPSVYVTEAWLRGEPGAPDPLGEA